MKVLKTLINIISNLKKIKLMTKNNNTSTSKKKILMLVQTVLEVAGLGITIQ